MADDVAANEAVTPAPNGSAGVHSSGKTSNGSPYETSPSNESVDQNILNRDYNYTSIVNSTVFEKDSALETQTHFWVLHVVHLMLNLSFFVILFFLYRWVSKRAPWTRPLPTIPTERCSSFERALNNSNHPINRRNSEGTYLDPTSIQA